VSGGASDRGGAGRTTGAPYINQETLHAINTRQIHPAIDSSVEHAPYPLFATTSRYSGELTYTYARFCCVVELLSNQVLGFLHSI
jgi:hypothetical protein